MMILCLNLKAPSYIKAFFSNIVLSAEIKATSEVTKNVLVYVPIHLLEILYRK